jgi:V8-like Glu-specific endopeptidase
MGDRPTFLDVSYLALGYERARSVAKLRMRFKHDWYTGTAFLIDPKTLLTAHHNLWTEDAKRADEMHVIFDHERSIAGPSLEVTTCPSDPGSFIGDATHDWALLKLREPQLKRPLAPLAKEGAKLGDRVAIIQHPGGMLKQVALHHNLVTFANDLRVQYLTDTLPGSSGSPVFDNDWRVVAVHHAGGDLTVPGTKHVLYRNEGTSIQCILAGTAARGIQL